MNNSPEQQWMQTALAAAAKGHGRTAPNPMVGAVIVKEGQIIAQGYHKACGEDHAEIMALNAAGEEARGADMYVTLEPCNHTGRTGPCSQALIGAGIVKVIIAMDDPNPVAAGGKTILEQAGIKVISGIMQEEARFLNREYIKNIQSSLPYVYLKWAMTLDGAIATRTGDSQWISNEDSRKKVHAMRNTVSAVLIGAGTAAADNPRLTCRLPEGRHPHRIIADPRARLALNSHLAATAHEVPVTLIVAEDADQQRIDALQAAGITILRVAAHDGILDLKTAFSQLYAAGITSILVEGGGVTAGHIIDARLADEAIVFCAPSIFGGAAVRPVEGMGVASADQRIKVQVDTIDTIENDICIQGRIRYPA